MVPHRMVPRRQGASLGTADVSPSTSASSRRAHAVAPAASRARVPRTCRAPPARGSRRRCRQSGRAGSLLAGMAAHHHPPPRLRRHALPHVGGYAPWTQVVASTASVLPPQPPDLAVHDCSSLRRASAQRLSAARLIFFLVASLCRFPLLARDIFRRDFAVWCDPFTICLPSLSRVRAHSMILPSISPKSDPRCLLTLS
jgi:hypothetical protein